MMEMEIRFYDSTMSRYYSLSPCAKDKIWIENSSGDSGSFDADLIYAILHAYFKNSF